MNSWLRTALLGFLTSFFLSIQVHGEEPHAVPNPIPVSKIIGQVLDYKTKQPFAGLPVVLSDEPKSSPPLSAHLIEALRGADTNKEGRPFAISREDGTFEISFATQSRKQLELELVVCNEMGAELTRCRIKAYQGEVVSVMPIEFTLPPRKAGQVVDDKNLPVPNAVVYANGNTYITKADGSFTDVSVPPRGFGWEVVAPGFALKQASFQSGDGLQKSVISLTPCQPVIGKVVDADGKPAKGVRVYAGTESINARAWYTVTDENGGFSIRTVWEQPRGMPIFPASEKSVLGQVTHLVPGQKDLVLKLFPLGRLELLVNDAQGQPLEKQQVQVVQMGARSNNQWALVTNPKGEVVIDPIPVGEYVVHLQNIKPPEHSPESKVTVELNQTAKTTLTFSPTKTPVNIPTKSIEKKKLSGIVLDALGHPALHVRVIACYRSKSDPVDVYHGGLAITEIDGHFEMELTSYNWRIAGGLRDPAWSAATPPKGDERVHLVALLQEPNDKVLDESLAWSSAEQSLDTGALNSSMVSEHVVTLNVHHANGTAFKPYIDMMKDEAEEYCSHRVHPVYALGSSELRVGYFKKGVVKARLKDVAGNVVNVAIPEGAQRMDVQFPSPRSVDFLITDSAGKPVPGIKFIQNTFPIVDATNHISDKDGKIHFECTAEAAGIFGLFGLNYNVYKGSIVAGSEPLLQTIQLTESRSKLSGVIRDGKGNPIPQARVSLSCVNGWLSASAKLEIKKDGTFSVQVPENSKVFLTGTVMAGENRLIGQSNEFIMGEGETVMLDLVLTVGGLPVVPPAAPQRPIPPPDDF